MNVVSHSIANIFKRILVVLSLSIVGSRNISEKNILGICMATCGLLIYTHGKTNSNTRNETENTKTRRWKSNLFIFLSFVISTFLTAAISGGVYKSGIFDASAEQKLIYQDFNAFRESRGLDEVVVSSINYSHIVESETDPAMRDFLSWRLIDHPESTDLRAKTLTRNRDVIEEAQRILVNLLQDLLGKAKHVMLIEIAIYGNKGDPAISMGEVMLLRRMNISIVFYCETANCTKTKNKEKALEISRNYSKDDLVILMQGGGNLVGYSYFDYVRKAYIDIFPDRKIIIFSQSIWLKSKNSKSLEHCRKIYSNHSNIVMFLRDRQSLEIAKENFNGVKFVLAPDMAFGIGMVPRQMPPMYDIMWLKRTDDESSKYKIPQIPENLTVHINDWWHWISNKGQTSMETSFLVASEGFEFLQRGRVVVTDRLHGHILSTLMNIPHVLIDNPPYFKLSSFDKSWTQSLSNTIIINNGSHALIAAMELLKRYHDVLPSIGLKDMNAEH